MANKHTAFWLALLAQDRDAGHRARLWNGYLGWKLPPKIKGEGEPQSSLPQLVVDPPDGGWPELTQEEHEILETIAKEHGGYPEYTEGLLMNFSGHTFSDTVNFSGLIMIGSNFNSVRFKCTGVLFDETRFYGQAEFRKATFEGIVHWHNARFNAPVSFAGSCFKQEALFLDVEFRSEASFIGVEFERGVMFNDSKFEEKYFPKNTTIPRLVDFRNAKFMAETFFRRVLFGNDENAYSPGLKPERLADFSGAEFRATTDFRRAIFNGAPAFFETTLHEDTDFSGIDWEKAETDRHWVDYAIRAWERLELIMSKLEKPLDRYQFFRLKMRARRRADGRFLKGVNWLFETIADYGWGVERAFSWWLGHWLVASLILLANTCFGTTTDAVTEIFEPARSGTAAEWWKLPLAALGTGFANAHAFLFLTANGGYLEKCRKLLEDNDAWSLLTVGVGTVEAVLGPILLFLLLLTLRNRFRLA